MSRCVLSLAQAGTMSAKGLVDGGHTDSALSLHNILQDFACMAPFETGKPRTDGLFA